MINIKIICVGKIKEKYIEAAISEYSKRLSRFCNLEIIELDDEKLPSTLTSGNISNIKNKEASSILNKLENIKNCYIFCLDETGTSMSSKEFANTLNQISISNSTILFIIGGSLGLSDSLKQKSNSILSFSKMTFPHQLFRVILLEQLFRAFKINGNEQYHH